MTFIAAARRSRSCVTAGAAVVAAVAWSAPWTAAAADAAPPSIAVLDLAPAAPGDAALAALLSEALTQSVAANAKGARVIGQGELKGMLGAAALQQLLGCDDERCAADLSQALAVDQLVVGRAGRTGDQVLVFVALVDAKQHAVRARASDAFGVSAAAPLTAGPAWREPVERAARRLFHPEAAAAGDKPLAELRVAVLLDELDERGERVRAQPVEICVQKALLAAGASVVSPAVVAALKGKARARDILDGRLPEELGSDEIDVLFAGVVETTPHAGDAAQRLGIASMRAQLGAQLVRIDTGDVLASEQPSAVGKGHSVEAARADAGVALCGTVRALLESALVRRIDVGQRTVLEVSGVDAAGAAAFVAALESRVKRVGRAKLKRSAAQKAIIDVALVSGDGIALALELADMPGVVVDHASAGLVKVHR